MVIFADSRVSTFWDNDALLEKNKDQEAAWKMYYLKSRCLEKIVDGEWTVEEYRQFEKPIKKMSFSRFIDFYDFIILYLDLSNKECQDEIKHLSQLDFIKRNLKHDSFQEVLVSSVCELQNNIFSLGRLPITEEEKKLTFNSDNKVSVYNDVLAQLKDSNSDYTNTLKNAYYDLMRQAVKNPELREKINALDYKLINIKKRNIRNSISKAVHASEMKKVSDANAHEIEIFIKGRNRKVQKNKK